jgi:replicative DNA helicase
MSHEPKAPPHSIEAEQSVIGALLRDNNSVDRIGDLRTEHFFLGDNAVIFDEIMRQLAAGKSVDVISLMVSLGDKVKDCGSYLNQMAQNTPSSANIGRYASIVRDKAIKRGMIEFGKTVAEDASHSHLEATALLDTATSRLEKLAEARVSTDPVLAADDMVRYIEEIESRLSGGSRAIPTGYTDLDRNLSGGLRRGNLVVIAGRPAMGKTALALNIASNIAVDYSVLFFSMEMSRTELHDRNTASFGKIPLAHLLEPELLTPLEWERVPFATQKIRDLNLHVHDQGGMRLLDIRLKSKTVKRKRGLDLIVIDYLQLMDGDGDNRNAQIETITRGLKAMAKELECAVVLLSQLNRKVEERTNKRPLPSDLRDSGAIEQDADILIFPYRDEVYNPDSPDKGICEIGIPKIRQGKTGTVALTYLGEYTKFENCLRWSPRPVEDTKTRRTGLVAHL